MALIVRHLEHGFAREPHAAGVRREDHGILQPGLGVEPDVRSVGQGQLHPLPGGDLHDLHHVGHFAERPAVSPVPRPQDDEHGGGGAQTVAHDPAPRRTDPQRSGRRTGSVQLRRFEQEADAVQLFLVFLGCGLQPGLDLPFLRFGGLVLQIPVQNLVFHAVRFVILCLMI